MPSDDVRPKPDDWDKKVLQWAGAAWTFIYAVLAVRHDLSTGQLGREPGLELLMFWAPIACFLITFILLRSGGIFAFIVLGFATYMLMGEAPGDMREAPRAISLLTMLVGAPIVLILGIARHLDRKRKSEAGS